MKQLKVGSDFSGVGAFDQALRSLNVNYTKEYACDVCKWARLTYLHNYGTAKDIDVYNSEDCQRINNAYHMAFVDKKADKVKEEEWKFVEENEERVARSFSFYYPWNVYKRTIPQEPIDIYMTSPPCQSFSLAGKRLGKNDPRGILFFNSLEFIEKNKPKCFIFENVKGLLSDDDGHTFKEWIHYLGGKSVNGHPVINFGDCVPYHVYYKVLNAKEHGVPQNRERIFIIGFRDEEDRYFNWPDTEPLKKTLMDVLEHNVDEKYYLSDTMVKRLKIKQKDGRAVPFYQGEDKAANCLVATYYKTPTDGQYVDQDKINVIGELDRPDHHEQANRVYDSNGLDSPMIMEIGALRGRNLEDISNRTSGIDTEQILEMNSHGVSNTLTTVQKDNVVVETKIIKNQRSEDGKLNRQINKSEFGIDTGSFKDQELVAIDQEFSDTILANPNHTKEGLVLETIIGEDKRFNNKSLNKILEDNELDASKSVILDTYNQTIQEEISPTITTRVDASNNFFLAETKVVVHKRPNGEKEREIILSDQDYVPTITAQPAYTEGLVAEKFIVSNLDGNQSMTRYDGISPCLTSAMGMGGGTIPMHNYHHRIRKLTPRECFRLMDFPEDFDFSVVANSHSYKQAGNSIVRRVLAKMIDNFSFINQYKNQ